jgi:hypothetical protein
MVRYTYQKGITNYPLGLACPTAAVRHLTKIEYATYALLAATGGPITSCSQIHICGIDRPRIPAKRKRNLHLCLTCYQMVLRQQKRYFNRRSLPTETEESFHVAIHRL